MVVDADRTLDVTGLNCPIPVVKTSEAMDDVPTGQVLEVLATDPGAESDLSAWANRTGNEFLGVETEDDVLTLYIRKTA